MASQRHTGNHGDRYVVTGVREISGAPTYSTYSVNSYLQMVSFVALAAS